MAYYLFKYGKNQEVFKSMVKEISPCINGNESSGHILFTFFE